MYSPPRALTPGLTTDGAQVVLDSFAVDPGESGAVEVVVHAFSDDGKSAGWRISAEFVHGVGVAIVETAAAKVDQWKGSGTNAWDAVLESEADGNHVLLKVTGEAGRTIEWGGWAQVSTT